MERADALSTRIAHLAQVRIASDAAIAIGATELIAVPPLADACGIAAAVAGLRAAGDAALPIQLTGLRLATRHARLPTLAADLIAIPGLADMVDVAAAVPAPDRAAGTDTGGA